MNGKTVLHYRILEKLGEGGMGVVYLADDTKLERQIAIKFLPKHIAASDEEGKRFKVEAQAAAALNHPNIATIHAIEEYDNELFIVMEYISGHELKELISKGPLEIDQAIDIATQIAEGLQSAQEKGIVHRDIKSSNIMVTDDGKVKIMDFGLAKIGKGIQLTREQSTLGTAPYMSPEQIRGDDVDSRSDIWSFGVVLYEMATGELPFEGAYEQAIMYSIINDQPQQIDDPDGKISDRLKNLIYKCLEKTTDNRYQSFSDISNDLKMKQNGENSSSYRKESVSSSVLSVTRKKINRVPYFIGGVLIFLLAGLFHGFLIQGCG